MKISDSGILISISILLFTRCDGGTFPQGERLYHLHCAGCHMEDGTGLEAWHPPLKNADYLLKNVERLPCIIRYGLNDKIQVNGVVYDTPMPGNPKLDEAELNNLINFINYTWGNKQFFKPETISDQLDKCLESE